MSGGVAVAPAEQSTRAATNSEGYATSVTQEVLGAMAVNVSLEVVKTDALGRGFSDGGEPLGQARPRAGMQD